MPDRAEQLNQLIDRAILDPSATPAASDRELDALVNLARDLQHLPREEFRSDLKNQLEGTEPMTTTSYIPLGLGTVTPYLLVRNPAAAIDFYRDVFGATEIMRHEHEGHVVHAKVRIGDSTVELGEHGARTDADVGALPPVGMHLFVQDVDAVFAAATAAGARGLSPIEDQYYGDP